MFRTLRLLFVAAAAAAALSGTASVAGAQDSSVHRTGWEFLVSNGKLVPTGSQRGALQTGDHTAAQLSRAVWSSVAITSTLGWARSHNRAVGDTPYLNVFMLDVGSEARAPRRGDGSRLQLNPFLGAGAGVRSYVANSVSASARYNLAGYVAAGSELGTQRVRIRFEARDYVSGFRAFDGTSGRVARNDVVVVAGLRLAKP